MVLLIIAYNIILIARHTKTITFKMTGFPIIIAHRGRVIGFKITGFTTVIIKLKGFFKRIISVYMANR